MHAVKCGAYYVESLCSKPIIIKKMCKRLRKISTVTVLRAHYTPHSAQAKQLLSINVARHSWLPIRLPGVTHGVHRRNVPLVVAQ